MRPPALSRARTLARGGVRRLPPRVRRGLVSVAYRVRKPADLVTVVVTVTRAQTAFLDECLDSVRAQTHTGLEVVVVPVGADPGPSRRAEGHAGQDRRIRVVHPRADLASARNHGAAAGRGSFLLHVQGAHTLPDDAVEGLVSSLRTSRSAVAVGRVARPGAGPEAAWLADLRHEDARAGAAPVEVARALAGAGVDGTMFARSAWQPVVDVLEGEGTDPTVVGVIASAARVDLVDVTACVAHDRGTGRAFGHMGSHLGELPDWCEQVGRTCNSLAGRGGALVDSWLVGLLLRDLPALANDVERMDRATWASFRRTWEGLLTGRSETVAEMVPVHVRLLAWLLLEDHPDRFTDLVAARWFDTSVPTAVVDGEVVADLEDAVGPVPADLVRLRPRETRLCTSLRRVRPDGDLLHLDLVCFVRNVDLLDLEPRTSIDLVSGDLRVPCAVRTGVEPSANRWGADTHHDVARGALTASVDVARLADARRWDLEVHTEVAGLQRTGPVTGLDLVGLRDGVRVLHFGPHTVTVSTSVGRVGLSIRPGPPPEVEPRRRPAFVVVSARLRDGALVLEGSWRGPAPDRPAASLTAGGIEVVGTLEDVAGSVRIRFVPERSRWGRPVRPLPSGVARFRAGGLPVVPDVDLLSALPVEVVGERHRVRWVVRDGELAVLLSAPLRDDEIGPRAQQRLREAYRAADGPVDPGLVYLQAYTGGSATDSPLAVHQELLRQGRDLRLCWGVSDLSAPLPDGAEPVLIRSREWYDVLARAGSLVSNVNFDRWFAKRPGQRVLQTFHGYPSKAMGRELWAAKEFTPRRVEVELARSRADWDVILTPVPEMDVHYRRQYSYEGPILSVGYPRDDALLAPDADRVRASVRRTLGIEDHQTAVLYAPTWRDDLATNFRRARAAEVLDLELASAALGDDVVWLLRGHRFHPLRGSESSARLRDVSDHPEINDLILAADTAVLDYSSLRFDFALTGRPMVFLVPDLDTYAGGRGFLFDFAASAPGPLVATTAEVVEVLRTVAGGANPWAAPIAAFNATYGHTQDGRASRRVVDAFFGPA